jgi:SAM-dependent methyltransferase
MRRTYTRFLHAGLRFRCNICGARLRSFVPHGIPPEPNFLCPLCRSKPPHRLAAVFFDTHPELFFRGGLLLHVAPEPGLGQKLAERARESGMTYRCGGITGVGDQYVDLLSLPFDTDSISLVYCCHVLNALQEDTAAMREIHRVLHPEGVALLQVPAFYQGATTLETNGLEDRMAAFGDEGIYRCYTNADYEARLRVAGFEVRAFRASDVADDLVQRYQLKREILHVCRKRNETGT